MSDLELTKPSENVFEDLGVKNPDTALLKAELMFIINETIRKRKLSSADVVELFNIRQSRVSRLKNGAGDRFSLITLLRFLKVLRYNVSLCVMNTAVDEEPRLSVVDQSYVTKNGVAW